MSVIAQTEYPASEPISLAAFKNYAKIYATADDSLCTDLITAAREYIEDSTGLCLANRAYIQFEDGLPNIPYGFSGYAYSASQNAYFGYGPITPYPPMGWQPQQNPFEIQLIRNPVTSVEKIIYVDTAGNEQTLLPNQDFVVDRASSVARLTPMAGNRWPFGQMGTNSVRIYFTAGYTSSGQDIEDVADSNFPTPPNQITDAYPTVTRIPLALKVAIYQLATHWAVNREPVMAGVSANVPHALDAVIKSYRLLHELPVRRF